jgi:hypothetical protein
VRLRHLYRDAFMSFLVQVWASPVPSPEFPMLSGDGVMVRRVTASREGAPDQSALLFESEVEGQMFSEDEQSNRLIEVAFRRIGRSLMRLSFSLLFPFQVGIARVIPCGLRPGDEARYIYIPGPPPGIALFEAKVGFTQLARLDTMVLTGTLDPEVETAISWFLTGNGAPNSVQQLLCHWIGLESLAPSVSGPWQCRDCRTEMPECPACGRPTSAPKTVQSIRAYMENELGVERPEYKRLYEMRCKVSHGSIAMDPAGMDETSKVTVRVQQLLLQGIKLRLGWGVDEPPLIVPEGITVMGAPGLVMEGVLEQGFSYDHPF